MDIVNVLRTKIQADMNKATWEVNCILSNPTENHSLKNMEEWVQYYAIAHAKLDMLNRLKGQMDSDERIKQADQAQEDENKS